jgi:hypothetical protein
MDVAAPLNSLCHKVITVEAQSGKGTFISQGLMFEKVKACMMVKSQG